MSVQRAPEPKAEELGIDPKSTLNTPRGRANRAEQMRRAAEYSVDEYSMQGGRQPSGTDVPMAQPDARARARAADYVSVYLRWDQLGPEGRRDEIRNIINAQLAREGIPPVRVAFSNRAPGSAVFTGAMWTMALSQISVDGARPSAQDFAALVDNAVHETQHTVTTFRGVRVAMERKQFDRKSYVGSNPTATASLTRHNAGNVHRDGPGVRRLSHFWSQLPSPGCPGPPGDAPRMSPRGREAAGGCVAHSRPFVVGHLHCGHGFPDPVVLDVLPHLLP